MRDEETQRSMWNWGPVAVWACGVVQILAGVWLEMTGTSTAVVGSWLALQGSLDVAFAVRTALGRTFSWNDYLVEKLVGVPFSGLCVGAERWMDIHGVAENARAWSGGDAMARKVAKKVARKVVLVCARGVGAVAFGAALRSAKDAIVDKFREELSATVGRVFAREFADIRTQIEHLFRSSPSDAENLISDALERVVEQETSFLDRISAAGVEFLPTVVELALKFLALDVDED